MAFTKRHIKIFSAIVLLTSLLTCFFYAHEKLPKPLRAFTALLETPVALASGISYYLKLGIQVYESLYAVILTNFIFSVVIVVLVSKFFHQRN